MKQLIDYINEWKVTSSAINNVKVNEYNCIRPKESGTCLLVVVPYNVELDSITLYTYKYTYAKTDDILTIATYKFKKNEEGYYYGGDINSYYWRWVALFDEDALTFLYKLLENNKQKMNVFNICGSILKLRLHNDTYSFCCRDNENKNRPFYTKYEIKNMIDIIKGSKVLDD